MPLHDFRHQVNRSRIVATDILVSVEDAAISGGDEEVSLSPILQSRQLQIV